MAHDVALLPGDGIGPEVIDEAVRVLDAAAPGTFSWTRYPFGAAHWKATGETLPDTAVAELGAHEAVLLGALGAPDVPMGLLEREVLLRLRFALDLYVNLRPARRAPDCDLVVVRENTEGLYAGVGGALRADTPYEVATEVSLNTYPGVHRLVRYGFELAASRPRHHVTLVHKANVLRYAGALWRRVTEEVAASYPAIEVAYGHVDAVCALVVTEPQRYDVIVTDNLFGDIVSDVTAVVAGGLGVAASGTFNPETRAGVFEPVHGSAPDISGRGIANPIAAIRSAALLCRHVGEAELAYRLDTALDAVGVPPAGAATRSITDQVLAKLT